jgi:hypothetical protein
MCLTRISYPHHNSSILRSSRLGLRGARPAQAKSWAEQSRSVSAGESPLRLLEAKSQVTLESRFLCQYCLNIACSVENSNDFDEVIAVKIENQLSVKTFDCPFP